MPERLRIGLIGPLALRVGASGDVAPRLRKARAVLAVLCLSRNHRRPRAAIEDMLWGDRECEQASGSLRSALWRLREAFADARDAIVTEGDFIALDRNRFDISLDVDDEALIERLAAGCVAPPELLEGLEGKGGGAPALDDWLREQRAWFRSRIDAARERAAAAPRSPAPPRQAAPLRPPRGQDHEPGVRVEICDGGGERPGDVIARSVAADIMQTLKDSASIASVGVSGPSGGVRLRIRCDALDQAALVNLCVIDDDADVVMWTTRERVELAEAYLREGDTLAWLVNRAVDAVKDHIRRRERDAPAVLGLRAVSKLFDLRRDGIDDVDGMLSQAFEGSEAGVFIAWRAYARTFEIGELGRRRGAAVADEAEALVSRALERGRANSTALALASYVHAFILQRYELAHELASEAVRLNPGDPLAQAYLSRAKLYLGDVKGGYRHAALARRMSGPSPYRYHLDFIAGVAALSAGRYEEALSLGELVASTTPGYRAAQRYLPPLYLKLGRREDARRAFERLKRIEPDYSLDLLRDPGYPGKGLAQAGLTGFRDCDL